MSDNDPQSVGAILKSLIKKMGYEKKLSELDAVNLWSEVVGDKIAQVSRAEKIVDGVLTVRVSNPVWRQQMIFLKQELIAGINARLGKPVVKDIFLV